MELDQRRPQLFTCPTDAKGLEGDDLGETLFNPVFSNLEKLRNDTYAGCFECDMILECPGPVGCVLADTSEA